MEMKYGFGLGVRPGVRSDTSAEPSVGNDHNSTTKPHKHTLHESERADRGDRVSTEGTLNHRKDTAATRGEDRLLCFAQEVKQ